MKLGRGGTGHGGRWKGNNALLSIRGLTLPREPAGCMDKGNICDGGGTEDSTIGGGGSLRKVDGGGAAAAGGRRGDVLGLLAWWPGGGIQPGGGIGMVPLGSRGGTGGMNGGKGGRVNGRGASRGGLGLFGLVGGGND